jgi:hypothetical protein
MVPKFEVVKGDAVVIAMEYLGILRQVSLQSQLPGEGKWEIRRHRKRPGRVDAESFVFTFSGLEGLNAKSVAQKS